MKDMTHLSVVKEGKGKLQANAKPRWRVVANVVQAKPKPEAPRA
jgi:hypothetical protein